MAVSLVEVIKLINQADDPAGRRQPLPDDSLIEKYEQQTGIVFPEDYKIFLKSISNAFVGFMSPFVLNEDLSKGYGDLVLGLRDARKVGVPDDWLPICEDNGNYYCLAPDGSVQFWDHNGSSNETWPDLATWAKEVWLEGG
ncbi:MAG: SMI1/KNR4 family protein [Pseudomonadota bacterium]